jgi:aminoglycoside 3-N-acetyltransferase
VLKGTDLIKDFRALGVNEADTVVIHSSYKGIIGDDKFEGGPEALISALKEAVGKGTLMLPTLSWEDVDEENPFDIQKTPSCVGILPEFMRKSKDVYRSIHPTHSIAIWGKDAKAIAEAHINDYTPVGPNSPLQEVRRRNGKIIMLACPLETNTSMHGLEEMVVPPYLYSKNTDYELILADGSKLTKPYLNHGFSNTEQRYERILDVLSDTDYRRGKVLNGECTVMNAFAVWDKGLAKLREDICFFVDMTN